MRGLLSRSKPPALDERLESLRTIVDVGRDRLDPVDVDAASSTLEHAAERLGHGAEWTVVALAGATGSGKSSLFNALAGTELSEVGVRRPTTGAAHAAVWADSPPAELLDWLGVARRHHLRDPELDGLVLLDLPDHDSTERDHRVEVDRLAELVDIFVWVVDPQKYADAALHEGYLRPLASHAAVTTVVLNQVDRLTDAERRQCAADVSKLVAADGLRDVPVLATSARSGEGISEVRALIASRVAEERAALERLMGDLARVVGRIERYCAGDPQHLSNADVRRLNEALADAARVDVVTDAVAKAHRRDAGLAVGWPFTRWLRRFRADPLERLHLRRPSGGAARTSLDSPTQLQRAEVEIAIRGVSQHASEGLPVPWPDTIHRRAAGEVDELLEDLDRAVSRTDLGTGSRPRWWSVAGALQNLLAAVALAGFAWLTVLFALGWLQIPRPPTPDVEGVPWPTILLLGGLGSGFVLAVLFGAFARFGAARRSRRARGRLVGEVEKVAHERVLAPIETELAARGALCDAVARLRR